MHKQILAISAHFDDIELGCGGTLAKHARAGDNVYLCCNFIRFFRSIL